MSSIKIASALKSAKFLTTSASKKQALSITDNATIQIKKILSLRPGSFLKIGVKSRGCSGMSYFMDYTNKRDKFDEEVVVNNCFKLYIDSKAQMTLLGAEMDYVMDDIKSEFVFKNAKIKGLCGCGESFHI